MSNKTLTVRVVPCQSGGWDVKIGGLPNYSIAHYETKVPAVNYGRAISIRLGAELFIHRADGTIQKRDSHGNDPYPPRG